MDGRLTGGVTSRAAPWARGRGRGAGLLRRQPGDRVQSPARAEPCPQESYRAELDAAVEATGIFTTGSTVLLETRNGSTGVTVSMTVNPDGSLLWTEEAPKSDYVMKCVRVDRCWALSRAGYGNVKWHRLPAGSVAFEQTRAFWAEWTAFPWPETATYDVAPTPEGARAFSVISTSPDLSLVETTVVDGTSVADTLFVVGADGSLVPARSVVMRAQAERVPVAPPPVARWVGRRPTEHLASGDQQLTKPASAGVARRGAARRSVGFERVRPHRRARVRIGHVAAEPDRRGAAGTPRRRDRRRGQRRARASWR